MIRSTVRPFALVFILFFLPASSLLAQEPASKMSAQTRAQLWPERALSPAEQELKDHIIVLRDSLAGVDAAAALAQRQALAKNSKAVVRSSGLSLQRQCDRSVRASGVMREYSVAIATDDEKWGQPAVRTFRAAVVDLLQAMTKCSDSIGQLDFTNAESNAYNKLGSIALESRNAIAAYSSAASGLLNTLKIPIEVRGRYGRNQ